jgi:hypothetical protein
MTQESAESSSMGADSDRIDHKKMKREKVPDGPGEEREKKRARREKPPILQTQGGHIPVNTLGVGTAQN